MASILAYYHSYWLVTRKPYRFQPAESNAYNKGMAGRLFDGCEIQWEVGQTKLFPYYKKISTIIQPVYID